MNFVRTLCMLLTNTHNAIILHTLLLFISIQVSVDFVQDVAYIILCRHFNFDDLLLQSADPQLVLGRVQYLKVLSKTSHEYESLR